MAKKRSSKGGAATQSTASKKTESSVDQDVITLDLQNFLTPIAIVISGMMISATLFFSIREVDIGSDVKGTSDNTVAADSGNNGDTGAAAPTVETFEDAETDIDDDPILGNRDSAKVAIVEFSDYECPFCARHWSDTHGQLKEKYIDTGEVIFVYRDLPLGFHQEAKPAAVAANCARDQGNDETYYAYHDLLFERGVANGDSDYDAYAEELGLNMGKFNDCQASGKFDDEIQNDTTEGNNAGVTGTPGFIIGELDDNGNVINGKKVAGAYPYATFEGIIEDLL